MFQCHRFQLSALYTMFMQDIIFFCRLQLFVGRLALNDIQGTVGRGSGRQAADPEDLFGMILW